jgi:hypothetical protein
MAMKQSEFESLLFIEVADRAAAEPTPPPGADKYDRRPWLQLRDEMVANNAHTVGELRADRIVAFYHCTNSVTGGLLSAIRGLFEGSPSV